MNNKVTKNEDWKMERWKEGKMERRKKGKMERWKEEKKERWKDGMLGGEEIFIERVKLLNLVNVKRK